MVSRPFRIILFKYKYKYTWSVRHQFRSTRCRPGANILPHPDPWRIKWVSSFPDDPRVSWEMNNLFDPVFLPEDVEI